MRANKTLRTRSAPPTPEPLIVPVKTCGQMLGGIGSHKVKRLIRAGLLDGVMVGPNHFVIVASIHAFVERGERAWAHPCGAQ